jgi:hypothetical protein
VKVFIFVVVLALLGWWGYRHGYLKPEWLGIGGSASTSSGTQGESLQATLNRGLPRMVSSEISLDRAAANNLAVSFDYRLVDLDQFAVSQRYGSTLPAEMQSQLVRDLCGNRTLREQVLAKGREVQVQVRAQDGRTMYTTQLKPGSC